MNVPSEAKYALLPKVAEIVWRELFELSRFMLC